MDALRRSKECVEHFRQTDDCMYIGMPNLYGNILKSGLRGHSAKVLFTGSNPVVTSIDGDRSSVGRASDCGSECRAFDSRRLPQYLRN